jgi:hypothetical protein
MFKRVLLAAILAVLPSSVRAQAPAPQFEILTFVDNQWTVLDSSGQIVRTLSILPAESPGYLDISRDGSRLAFMNRNWQTWEHDFAAGTSRFLFQANWNSASVWLPGSSTTLAYNDESGKLLTFDTTSGTQATWQLNDTVGNRVLTRVTFDGAGQKALVNIHYPAAGGMGVFIADVCHADSLHALCNIQPLAWPGNGSTSWSNVAANGFLTTDGLKAVYFERAPGTNGSIFVHDIATNTRTRAINWTSGTEVEAVVNGLYADRYAVVRGLSKQQANHSAFFVCDIVELACSEIFRRPGSSSLGPAAVARNIGGDTTPPELTIPGHLTVEATSPGGATITYDSSAIDDVDGSVAVTCAPSSGSTFAIGATTVSCSAADSAGNTSTSSFTVTVVDTTPPQITAISVSPDVVWPPNGKMVNVVVTVAASDLAGGSVSCALSAISGDDQATNADWLITGPLTASIRAKRIGRDGRTYTLAITCRDERQNAAHGQATVFVPHDRRK